MSIRRLLVTTLSAIAKHTGLDKERVKQIIDESGNTAESITIDEARLIIIKKLRAIASGTTQKEQLESETAKNIQAQRIKITEQTKHIREALRPQRLAVAGYLNLSESASAQKSANARYLLSFSALQELINHRCN